MECVVEYQHELLYISLSCIIQKVYHIVETLLLCANQKKNISAKLVVPICRDLRNLITSITQYLIRINGALASDIS